MGGTFARLVDQGHDVHVAYQTSGNIAVNNSDVLKFIEVFSETSKSLKKEYQSIINLLLNNNTPRI